MRIPYGIADFRGLRARDQLYLDRTGYIPVLEEFGNALLFVRPRRFGKSLWLSVLESYYDLRTAAEHETLFAGLAAGEQPTPLAHRYFVMRWDFSKIDPDPPAWGVNAQVETRHERIGNELRGYLNTTIRVFQRDYGEHLPEILELDEDPFHNFEELLSIIRKTPYQLYLLIDEYDNFANEIVTKDEDAYRELVHSDGPFKYLFKWVKGLMGAAGLERFFITGVSPLVMSDVTSGMNIAENVYLIPELNALCGFTETEVRDLLERVHAEKSAGGGVPWQVDEAHTMLRGWYNGYRFTPMQIEPASGIYNPTLVLFFLKHLQRYGAYPRQMLDSNLAADDSKLDYIAQVSSSRDAVIDLVRKDKPLEISWIRDRFKLREILEVTGQDASFLGSYLYYLGMLTLRGEETTERTLELRVPNEVMRKLYVDSIRRLLMPLGSARSAADAMLFAFLRSGDLEPILDFIEETLFPDFSNRDATWANELTVKTIFLTLLWNDANYITYSEPELAHRYADLCLLRRPDVKAANLSDLLFEFKRISLKKLGMRGQDVKAASRDELMELEAVKQALTEADVQLVAYRKKLRQRHGKALRLRAYAVVALGFERLVVRLLSPPA